jgi:membrane protein implicated in regulation of membrane protease activity
MKFFSWMGTAFGIAGALLVALNVPISGWGFVLFLVSSLSWLTVALSRSDRPLALINAAFTLCNLLGIYRWLS